MPKIEDKNKFLFPEMEKVKKENPVSYVDDAEKNHVRVGIAGKELVFGLVDGEVVLISNTEDIRFHDPERKISKKLREQAFAIARNRFKKKEIAT